MSMIQDNDFPQAYESSFIKTLDGHELYYEIVGNPEGIPIIFLHGGPGSGCQKNQRDLFNLDKVKVIFVDQRGAGKSLPKRSLNNNTTDNIISDLELIRQKLDIGKWLVVGGSWGSTLALAYAQIHKKNILGIIIRSVFLGTEDEINWAFSESAKLFRPELWDSWINIVKKYETNEDPLNFYGKKLESVDSDEAEVSSIIWSIYESTLSQIEGDEKSIPKNFDKDILQNNNIKPNTPYFEWHYIKNNFFLENNQLLDNADILNGIPGKIVQGRYDLLCPPINAYNIAKKWKDVELIIVEDAAHSANTGALRKILINAINDLVDKYL